MKPLLKTFLLLSFAALLAPGILHADGNTPPASGDLLDMKDEAAVASVKNAQTAAVGPWQEGDERGVKIEYAAASEYPGAFFPNPPGGWDLSSYHGVAAEVSNQGKSAVKVALRVDNDVDWKLNPWNAEFITVGPGDTKVVRVTFGKSYGNSGYNLDPMHVVKIQIFLDHPADEGVLIVKSLKAVE